MRSQARDTRLEAIAGTPMIDTTSPARCQPPAGPMLPAGCPIIAAAKFSLSANEQTLFDSRHWDDNTNQRRFFVAGSSLDLIQPGVLDVEVEVHPNGWVLVASDPTEDRRIALGQHLQANRPWLAPFRAVAYDRPLNDWQILMLKRSLSLSLSLALAALAVTRGSSQHEGPRSRWASRSDRGTTRTHVVDRRDPQNCFTAHDLNHGLARRNTPHRLRVGVPLRRPIRHALGGDQSGYAPSPHRSTHLDAPADHSLRRNIHRGAWQLPTRVAVRRRATVASHIASSHQHLGPHPHQRTNFPHPKLVETQAPDHVGVDQ